MKRLGPIVVAAIVFLAGCRGECGGPGAQPIEIRAETIALFGADPNRRRVGALEHRGGLVLTSPDARFGGLSGLLVAPDGTGFVAVSDRGYWVEAGLMHEGGELVGVSDGTLRCMLDERGRVLEGSWADAEGLARVPGEPGAMLVSFERQDRILRYDRAREPRRPDPVPAFEGLDAVDHNRGLEAIEFLADGALLAITEATRNDAGDVIGWLRDAEGDRDVTLRLEEGWGLTSFARMPAGDVLTLERWFRPPADLRIRLRRIAAADIGGAAPLDGAVVAEFGRAHAMDNMEGLDVRTDGERVLVYMVSDDNYNPLQRTILHLFEWIGDDRDDPAQGHRSDS